MATQATLELFLNADSTVQVNVKQSDGTTAQTMTGWALAFRLRRNNDDSLVVSKATGGSGITIGNGSGTDDRATIAIADTDTAGWPAGRDYSWSLWRAEAGSDIPLAYGNATLVKVAGQ